MLPHLTSSQLWDFKNIAIGPSTALAVNSGVSVAQPRRTQPTFRCVPAKVAEPSYDNPSYASQHLLGLPLEIRRQIWRTIFIDIVENPSTNWFNRPKTHYDNVSLVCRQIWHEILYFWPRMIVPHNRIQIFLIQTFSISILKIFKQLAIELPFNSPIQFFQETAKALEGLSPVLQDVRIYFVGKDKYGVPTKIDGCGIKTPSRESIAWKLMIDGQGCQERFTIFQVLANLQNLRTLVLSNPQFPLLQTMLLAHKPKLTTLRIFTDPRQTLHRCFENINIRHMVMPPTEDFPPVRVLQISANAGWTALQIASKVAHTLETLNWIVPDVSRQAGSLGGKWLHETGILLNNLGRNAKNLRTLRICIEGPIYEAHADYGNLILALRYWVPLMPLLTLEIHIDSRSPYLGEEILGSLPPPLTRLHISEKTVDRYKVMSFIKERYMSDEVDDNTSEFSRYFGDNAAEIEIPGDNIGEDLGRSDYIKMNAGPLGFIGYEYGGRESTKLKMLKINGRLLDRERNQHLVAYEARMIPPRTALQIPTSDGEVKLSAEGIRRMRIAYHGYPMSGKLYKPTYGETQTVLTQLRMSGFTEDKTYFGGECKAEAVFHAEVAAKIEDLPALKWMEEVDVEESDHWMSE